MPRLLVSVKNLQEAEAALRGGCDLLDIKDPGRGPLGMADPSVISDVIAVASQNAPQIPVSAALGELKDWSEDSEIPECLDRLSYLKLGNATYQSTPIWREDCKHLQRRFQQAGIIQPQWIDVCYADHRQANSFELETYLKDIAEQVEMQTVGLLIDTWQKTGQRLPNLLSASLAQQLSEALRDQNRLFALAGRLNRDDLVNHAGWMLSADILGVRSAVCVQENRELEIDESLVSAWGRNVRTLVDSCSV